MREGTAAHEPIRHLDDPGLGVASDVGASALQLASANSVAVFLYDETRGVYAGAARVDVNGPHAFGATLTSDAASTTVTLGSPVATFSLALELDGPLAEEARRMNAASLLVIRCDRGPRALGLLLCAFDEMRTFDAGDERDALAIARVASTTLDYARRTNAALDRADRLATLLDTASAFAGELDLESLFAAIHDQVCRHMDAPNFYVALESSEAGALRTEYTVEAGVRLQAESILPGGYVRQVFESARSLVIDAEREAALIELGPSGSRPSSAVYVPMRLRDRVIGVMSVQSFQPDAYNSAHLELLLELAEQAATAIQNAGMFREERRRMRELSVLHRLAALTNSEAHLDRIMAAIVTEAASAFKADAASIALENERGDFVLAATHGVSDAYRHTRIIPGPSLRALYGSPPTERFIGPDETEAMGQTELVAAEGITNWFLVPLLQQGRLIGSLALCGRDRVIRLSPSETGLARLFAEQAAAAMLRAQSAHALTERIEDYDLLTRVGRALVSRLEVDYDAILRLLHDQLGYTHLAILTFEGEPPALALKASLGHGDHGAMALEPDRGVIGTVAAMGEMLYLPDVSKDARYVQTTVDVQSELAYPLKYGGQVLGVLDVQSEARDAFTARDRRILAALADQCAIALSNARQYATAGARLQSLGAARAQLEQYAEYLERRQEDLKLVNAVSGAASATLNLDRILESAVRNVASGLRADRCSVGILDEDQMRIEIAAEYRPDGRQTSVGVKLPLGSSSMLAKSVTGRHTIATEDALADPRFADVRSEMMAMHVRGTVIVPLVAGGRVIGTLSVNSSSEPRRFTDEEIEVLETVANQLALGVRNARLYGRARDRANEDSLTGIFNHRYLHERLEFELLRARRAGHPLSIALFDLN
ncbi:MAG TPA: GAF domain-containing protein, partial [Candidatus Eremiobacteraceae bacterium]|nr:GAF domain-containing protein [Candidatus Eremiobacteraceae bacterium]